MSGNTLQYAETPDGKTALHAGTWHWIEDDERTSTADLVDTTISTSWETCDLSGRVPPGTVAIFGRFKIYSNDTDDLFVLMTRPYGSAETDNTKLNTIGYGADIGAWTDTSVSPAGTDAYELVTTGAITVPAAATGTQVMVRIKSTASNGEYCYWDSFRLKIHGVQNDHDNSLRLPEVAYK